MKLYTDQIHVMIMLLCRIRDTRAYVCIYAHRRTVFPRLNAAAFIFFAPRTGAPSIRGQRLTCLPEMSVLRTPAHTQ